MSKTEEILKRRAARLGISVEAVLEHDRKAARNPLPDFIEVPYDEAIKLLTKDE